MVLWRFLRPLVLFAVPTFASTSLAAPADPTPPAAGAPSPPPSRATVKATAPKATHAPRWTAETPDVMLDQAKARALAASSERSVLAALATIVELADRASYGRARSAFEDIAKTATIAGDVRVESSLLARAASADEGTSAGVEADRALGVLTDFAILGPFRDTGGGLAAKEGPEASGAFSDRQTGYSWGTVEVDWRAVPPAFATASGMPLDVFVHPRKESCTFLATRVTVDKARPIVVHLAATGQARLMFDGTELGRSDDVHGTLVFDRLAGKITATAGDHLVWGKVCSGALPDRGRVRFRVTDESGAPVVLPTSPELVDLPKTATKLAAQKVATPLARAIAVPETADADVLLDAAILRTLGGADDMKSPRAPGMLDAITHAVGSDPDRLAMSGWVAPSGANRSGWLNLARARAGTAHDDATTAFCDRRLVAEHLTAKLSDWALATLQGSHIGKSDPEGLVLHALTAQALGTDALRAQAMHDLVKAAESAPDKVPTVLLVEAASAAASFDVGRAFRLREKLASRGYHGTAFVRASAVRGGHAVAQASMEAFKQGALDVAEDGLSMARASAAAGDHQAARDLFRVMVEWSPNLPDAWAGLADELAVAPPPGQPGQGPTMMVQALRRARDLAPGEARYRAELALRSAAMGTRGAAGERAADLPADGREDERYLVSSQVLLARRQGAPAAGAAPDVADRELHWLRAVVMHPDRRVSQLIHYAREIVIAPRTQDELFEDLPAEGDLTEILRARVHRKDGGTAFPVEEHNEGARPRIRWPELSPGDTVEVAIRTWTSHAVGGRGDAPFYFLDYAGSPSTHPLLYNEVIVETTKDRPLYVDVINATGAWAPKREEKDEKGKHIIRLVWDKPASIPEEPLSPTLSELVPVILGSSFKSWTEFRQWYAEAVRGFTEPDAEVKRLAAELTKGKTSRESKLRALFDFVSDDIRYVNYVSGEWWLPNRPQQLLARREGDCDDKAMLLITLLRSVGIDAQEVMVQTRETGQPSVVLAKNVAVPLFDHGIAYLPGPGPNGANGTYLDATSPQSRLGPIPSMDARAVALRMDAGPAEIVRLPTSSPDDHGFDVNWTITLASDGAGDLVGEEKHIGDGAFWLRSYLTQPDARAQYVEDNLVGGWFPTVQVDEKIDFNGELPDGRAWVKYKAHSDGLARHEASDLVVPLSPNATLASSLAPLVKRTIPVSLPSYLAPSHQRRTIRIVAPPGFAWGDLPAGGKIAGGPFGSAALEVTKDPQDARTVIVKRTVVFDQSLIPVDKYEAWRAFIQQIDALMHKGVRLSPVGGGK